MEFLCRDVGQVSRIRNDGEIQSPVRDRFFQIHAGTLLDHELHSREFLHERRQGIDEEVPFKVLRCTDNEPARNAAPHIVNLNPRERADLIDVLFGLNPAFPGGCQPQGLCHAVNQRSADVFFETHDELRERGLRDV